MNGFSVQEKIEDSTQPNVVVFPKLVLERGKFSVPLGVFSKRKSGSKLNLVGKRLTKYIREAVKRVRVLVANRSRLIRDLILATIADQPDIEVVGEVFEESRLTQAVEELRPDALIMTLDNPENRSAVSGFLLGRYPKMRILALAPERNQGLYLWAVVDIRSQRLESSEASVLNALRAQPPVSDLTA